MVESEIPRIDTTCIYCEHMYEPADPISLNPVCPECSARASACRTATVREAIAREIGHPLDQVTPRSRLAEELGLGLFDVAELIDALETKFRTQIPDGVWRSFRTVADIERFLRPT